MKPAAPDPPEDPVPLFPEDSSLLGFVLGRPGARAGRSDAASPQPTGLARAARGLVNFVRSGKDASPATQEKDMPGLQRETPRVASPPFREKPEPAALRKPEAAAMERPAPAHSGSAVEQMRPLIPGLLSSLDEAMDDVRRGFGKADTIVVEEAAARIAAKADNYGLRILARMARCVEMAAKAQDKDALANILPDLETAVERNRIALQPKQSA
jgi:HPt (histidine-containing phosphotransfer) domain-containing protein